MSSPSHRSESPPAAMSVLDDVPLAQAELDWRTKRHGALCTVCQHADQHEINAAYIGWMDPKKVADAYGIKLGSLRRHAAYFSLDVARSTNVASLIGGILEAKVRQMKPEDLTIDDFMRLIDKLQGVKAGNTTEQLEGAPGVRPAMTQGATWEEMVRLRRVKT